MKTVKSKKISASAVASVLVIAIALTGTFAWQSISQRVKNEADGFANPGGRLHDDFNGENKDIYVENFTDPADGSPIFARVRLHEYMEIGPGAGGLTGEDSTAQVIGKADAQINDPSTWAVHTMGGDTPGDDTPIHKYWKWKMGGTTVYMPTFNKNRDSLAADINGTFEGPDGDRATLNDKYEDYIEYTLDSEPKTDIAYYDADNNTVDEGNGTGSGNGGTEGTNYTAVEETHTVQETGEGTVLSMAEWKTQGAPVGAFWVYDTDGWAYWAQAIQPGEATGLLLDGIKQELELMEKWYYAINAVGQFATAGDWGDAQDNTGFYENGITEDGLLVLNQAAADITIVTAGDADAVKVSKTLQLGASITLKDEEITNQDVTWTVSGNRSKDTVIDTSGLLTVSADEPVGTVLTISAESKAISGLTASKTITVKPLDYDDIPDVTVGSTTTVTIDGAEWYVLVKEGGKALLYAKNTVSADQKFGSSQIWRDSTLQTYLNGTWLNGTTLLKEKAVQTDVTTRSASTATSWITTQDKVFLLSEADLFGTFNLTATTDARDYTYGNKVLVPDSNMRKFTGSANFAWLRSPSYFTSYVACVTTAGTYYYYDYYGINGVRPALWVTYQ